MFLNREKEREEISIILNQTICQNLVLIITGRSGVGKSALVQHILQNELSNLASVNVQVSKSSPETIGNLHYLNTLYRAFVRRSHFNFYDRILSPFQYALGSISNLLKFMFKWLCSILKIPENSKMYEPTNENDVIFKKDYIIKLLNTNNFIIDIENIQNMDSMSFEILMEIIKNVKNTTFIFEFTLDDHNDQKLLDICNEMHSLETGFQIREIDNLDFDEAKRLIKDINEVNEDILRTIYYQKHGNLMLLLMANNKNVTLNKNPISLSFNALSKDEKFLLHLLHWNDGALEFSALHEMLLSDFCKNYVLYTPFILNDVIESLKNKNFVVTMAKSLCIKHDSIISELDCQPINPIIMTSYGLTKYYLNHQIKTNPYSDELMERLFILYIKTGDKSIFDILDYIKLIIYKCKYPRAMLAKLVFFQEKLEKEKINNIEFIKIILEIMTEVSHRLGFRNEAQQYLDQIYNPHNSYHIALQAGIYSIEETGMYKDKLKEMLLQSSVNSRLRLTLELCLLVHMIPVSAKKVSCNYCLILINNNEYKNYLEYGYLLRCYAELCDDLELAIDTDIKAYELFGRYGRDDLKAETCLSLAMDYAYIGDLVTARKWVEEAQTNIWVDQSAILNDLAAISILTGDFSGNVLKQLNDALLMNGDDYEKIIIMCNLLIYNLKTGRLDAAHEIVEKIEKSNYHIYEYDDFQKIVFQNLMYFYSATDIEKYQYYNDILKRCIIKDDLSNYKITNEHLLSPSNFYAQFPYRVDFLGYWEFSISNDL